MEAWPLKECPRGATDVSALGKTWEAWRWLPAGETHAPGGKGSHGAGNVPLIPSGRIMRISSREFYFIVQPRMLQKCWQRKKEFLPRDVSAREIPAAECALAEIFPLKRVPPNEGISQPQGQRAVLPFFQEKLAERKCRRGSPILCPPEICKKQKDDGCSGLYPGSRYGSPSRPV